MENKRGRQKVKERLSMFFQLHLLREKKMSNRNSEKEGERERERELFLVQNELMLNVS